MLMERAEHEPITGVWGRSPQRGPGAEPVVRGQSLPEAESLSAFQHPMKEAKFTPLTVSGKLSVCDVSSTLNRIPNTSLLSPEYWRIKAGEGDGPPGDGFQRE